MQTHALACTWMYKPRQRIARFLRMPKRQTQKSARQLIKNSYLKRIGRRSKVSAMQESAILLLQSEGLMPNGSVSVDLIDLYMFTDTTQLS